jgi:hypothetical protein
VRCEEAIQLTRGGASIEDRDAEEGHLHARASRLHLGFWPLGRRVPRRPGFLLSWGSAEDRRSALRSSRGPARSTWS